MTLSALVIFTLFAASFIVAVFRGIDWAFVTIFIPALILLNQLPVVQIPHLPMSAQFAPLYAMVLAIPFRGESLRFKVCSVDIIMILLLISATITAWSTEIFETGINTIRNDFFTWTAPYFLARIAFKDWQMRRSALYVLIGVLAVVSVAALIEFRFYPYFYVHVLRDNLGMGNSIQEMAYKRYDFNRVAGPVGHPIYFGNMCVVILGMIAVLARTAGLNLKTPIVAIALFSAFGCVVTSISFTPFVGVISGLAFLAMLTLFRFSRVMVLALTLLVVAIFFGYTYHIATTKLGDKPSDEFGGSQWTRWKIIQQSWNKAEGAGPFGFGLRPYEELYDMDGGEDAFDLQSVDNTYMQFTLTHGYVYTILWISLGVFFAFRMTRAFLAVQHPSQVLPLAISIATVLALMVSMYTVWAGSIYTVLWLMMLGLANTLIDNVLAAQPVHGALTPRGAYFARPIVQGPAVQGPAIQGPAFQPQPTMRITSS